MPQAFSFEEARKPDWLLQREKVGSIINVGVRR